MKEYYDISLSSNAIEARRFLLTDLGFRLCDIFGKVVRGKGFYNACDKKDEMSKSLGRTTHKQQVFVALFEIVAFKSILTRIRRKVKYG